MGPAEEVGKAAGSFMDIMRQQPLSLALVVMNLSLLAIFYFILVRVSDTRAREFVQLQVEQKEFRELLAKCVVPQKQSILRLPLPPSVSQTK